MHCFPWFPSCDLLACWCAFYCSSATLTPTLIFRFGICWKPVGCERRSSPECGLLLKERQVFSKVFLTLLKEFSHNKFSFFEVEVYKYVSWLFKQDHVMLKTTKYLKIIEKLVKSTFVPLTSRTLLFHFFFRRVSSCCLGCLWILRFEWSCHSLLSS